MGAAVAAALSVNFQLPEFQVTTQNVYRLFFGQPGNINSFRHVCLLVKKKSVKIAPGKQ